MTDQPHESLPRLYRVEVSFVYYAVAETPDEAADLAKDAAYDEHLPDHAQVDRVDARTLPSSDGWDGNALVYGADEDTSLDQALAARGLPSVAQLSEAYRERIMSKAKTITDRAPKPQEATR